MATATIDVQAIRGWLSEEEAVELGRLATGEKVLEVGSYCGRSTAIMAKVARHVIAIDDFRGLTSDDSPDDLREEFFRNLTAAGVQSKVTVLIGSLQEILPTQSLSSISMVFYDADHSFASTLCGLRSLIAAGLSPSARIVCHDYAEVDHGVIEAVDAFARETGRTFRCVDSLAIFDPAETLSAPPSYRVMLGAPGPTISWGTVCGMLLLAESHHEIQVTNSDNGWDDFNEVWCRALNAAREGKATHFVQCHSDITPQGPWLDTLIGELDAHDLDFVSAVCPIKDGRGVTSSGIGDPGNRWQPWRRFTMQEVCGFPETFTAADVGYANWPLLHNTGCWAADLRKPVFFETDCGDTLKAFFQFDTRIYRAADGSWKTARESEDWYFSRCLWQLGAKTAITRKVRLSHRGVMEYNNYEPWGKYRDGDQDTKHKWGRKE